MKNEKIETLLAQIKEQNDLRRKAAIELNEELASTCDEICKFFEENNLGGLTIRLCETGDYEYDSPDFWVARIKDGVMTLMIETTAIEPYTGKYFSEYVKGFLSNKECGWSNKEGTNKVTRRHLSVFLAQNLQKRLEAALSKIKKQTEETEAAIAKIKEIELA